MPPKQIIALGTYHEVQHNRHALNARFSAVIALIRESYGVQAILEEWWDRPEQSFASSLAADGGLEWRNVGTPDEARFVAPINGLNCHPPTYDPGKPRLAEYPPLAVQELRENYMVERIRVCMEPYEIGLFIVGLAHLHSMLSKLKAIGFAVRGYNWIEQK